MHGDGAMRMPGDGRIVGDDHDGGFTLLRGGNEKAGNRLTVG